MPKTFFAYEEQLEKLQQEKDRISQHCSMLLKSIQIYFRQSGNLLLSQEINKIALATRSFSFKTSQGFSPFSSQVTPYGAPPEVFAFGLCQLCS